MNVRCLANLFALAWLLRCATGLADDRAQRFVEAAKSQVGVTVRYDPSYQRLAFPGGDVPMDRGVCTDVIVRAYRKLGLDLQLLVNRDMRSALKAYPRLWGLRKPDTNIDHRRVPNLATYLARHGKTLPVSDQPADYAAGDIVVWRLSSGVPHIGIVADEHSWAGRPLVVHNIGAGAKMEDVLFSFVVTGHYRWLPPAAR